MLSMFLPLKLYGLSRPELRELDPTTVQRIKEGAYVAKLVSEIEVSARKCDFYAGNASNQTIIDFFNNETKVLNKAKHALQRYYESMTEE